MKFNIIIKIYNTRYIIKTKIEVSRNVNFVLLRCNKKLYRKV